VCGDWGGWGGGWGVFGGEGGGGGWGGGGWGVVGWGGGGGGGGGAPILAQKVKCKISKIKLQTGAPTTWRGYGGTFIIVSCKRISSAQTSLSRGSLGVEIETAT